MINGTVAMKRMELFLRGPLVEIQQADQNDDCLSAL